MSKSNFKRPPNKLQKFFARLLGFKKYGHLTAPPLNKMTVTLSEQGKHYFVDGAWHPVILDPMGEQTPAFGQQWLAEQRVERDALIATGASVSY
jgi:hypothetical protein